MAADRTERTVRLPDGSLRVEEAGPTDGPAVVFLHGWPQDASAWRRVVDHLSDDVRCLAPDLPGIGGSAYDEPSGDKAWLASQVRGAASADAAAAAVSGRAGCKWRSITPGTLSTRC